MTTNQPPMPEKRPIKCFICDTPIAKYKMDLGSTVSIDIKLGKKTKRSYICDDCCKKVSIRFIEVAVTG